MDYPLRVRSYRLRRDSGGAGRFRGGTGTVRVLEAVRGAMTCSYRSERHFTPAWGLFGGRPGAVWSTEVVRCSGEVEAVPSKRAFTLAAGDELRILSGGGGGHGSPLEREAWRVLADVLDGKVSADAARSVYGVVLNLAAQAVDKEATKELRTRLREEKYARRKNRDLPSVAGEGGRMRGENMDTGCGPESGIRARWEATAGRRILRPARVERRATSGRER